MKSWKMILLVKENPPLSLFKGSMCLLFATQQFGNGGYWSGSKVLKSVIKHLRTISTEVVYF